MAKPPEESDWTATDIQRLMANPINCIQMAEVLSLPHETIVPEQQWIRANANVIRQIGPETFLMLLLDVLKKGA